LLAYRYWLVVSPPPYPSPRVFKLGSTGIAQVSLSFVWERKVEAACWDHGTPTPGGPVDQYLLDPQLWKDHQCGVYALKDPREVFRAARASKGVVGSIQLYGVVLEGELGYRANKALVESIFYTPWTCSFCDKDREALYVVFFYSYVVGEEVGLVRPVCERHLQIYQRKGTFHDWATLEEVYNSLGNYYGVPVLHYVGSGVDS